MTLFQLVALRIMPALFEFVEDWADLLQVAV